ncbi:MAG: diguanylate cyclase [Gallionella sp.]|nr:MAG: diguanylate cyclase [Gallionella sp.]
MDTPGKIPRDLLARAMDQSRDGITIADAKKKGFPLIYVNGGFEKLTGYTSAEVIGKNYRILQGIDSGQPGLDAIRAAVAKEESCVVTLRNYRKDGQMFWNELSISPVHNAEGKLTHYIGIQKDVTARILLEQHLRQSNLDLQTLNRQLNTLACIDPLVGLSNRRHFDEQFASLRSTAQRTHSEVSVLMIDLDYFRQFNERYGRSAGDECLRMVGDCIARSFVRTSDCAARYDGEEFAVITLAANLDDLRRHAQKLCEQVRALNIPNGDSPHGIVTVSIGGVHRLFGRETTGEEIIGMAERELFAAKHNGRNCVHLAG